MTIHKITVKTGMNHDLI